MAIAFDQRQKEEVRLLGIYFFISILVQVLQQGQPWGAGSGGGGLQHRSPLSSGQLSLYLQ